MISNRFLARAGLAVLIVGLMFGTAVAEPHSSLNGSPQWLFPQDVNVFPHLAQDFSNTAHFVYGTNSSTGSAIATWRMNDSDTHLIFSYYEQGFAHPGTHKMLGMQGASLLSGNALAPFFYRGSSPTQDPMQWINVGVGMPNWGFIVRLASESAKVTNDTTTGNDDNGSTLISATVSALFGAYNLAFDVTVGSSKNGSNSNDPDDEVSSSNLGVSLTGLGSHAPLLVGDEWWSFFNGTYISADLDNPSGGSSLTNSLIIIRVGAGPVVESGNTRIAAFWAVGLTSSKNEITDAESIKNTTIELPGMGMSLQTEILSWLHVRTGIEANFILETDEDEADANGTKLKTRGLSSDWDAGVVIPFGDGGELSFTLSPDQVTNGFFLGSEDQAFSFASLTLPF